MRLTSDQVVAGLVQRGVPTHVAQGVVMNFTDESGLETGINERNPTSGRGGYGLAQWTGPRRTALEQFAAAKGKSLDDTDLQLDFFMHENSTSEASAWSKVMSAGTKEEAAASFVKNWERPAPEHLAARTTKYLDPTSAAGMFNPDLSYSGGEVAKAPELDVYKPQIESADFTQLASDAFMTEQSGVWGAKLMGLGGFTPQPGYSITEDQVKADFTDKGIDVERYSDFIGNAVSQESYDHIRGLIYNDNERVSRLQNGGLSGTVLQIANQAVDLAALPADIAVGAVAPELVLGRKVSRISGALYGALAGGVAGAGNAAVGSALNPHRDQSDILYGAVFGAGFGGAAGALFRKADTLAEADRVQRLGKTLAEGAETSPTVPAGSSVGAAQAQKQLEFLDDEAFSLVQDHEVAKSTFGKARVSLGAALGGSKNHVVRMLSGLVQDGVGKGVADSEGKIVAALNPFSVTEDLAMLHDEWLAGAHRVYEPSLKEYLKDTGAGWFGKDAGALEFREQLGKYIRDYKDGRADRYHPAVVRMGNKIAQLQADIAKMANNPFLREKLDGRAVSGFEKDLTDPHYLMRVWDARKVVDAEKAYSEGTIEKLIFGAMQSKNPHIDAKAITKAARGFAKAIRNRAAGVDDLMFGRVSAENVDELADAMVRHAGMTREEATDMLRNIAGKADDAGNVAQGKHRAILDEKYGLKQQLRKDGTYSDLSLEDLLHNDGMGLFQGYARKMAGNVSLARFRVKDPSTGEVIVNGITRDSEFDALVRRAQERNADLLSSGKITQHQADQGIAALQYAYNHIKGRPNHLGENTFWGDFSRSLRDLNFIRIFNQGGFAQAIEAGMIIGTLGVKASFSQMPALRRVLTQSGESIRKSGLANDLEVLIPNAVDNLIHNTEGRFDDLSGATGSLDRGNNWDKVNGVLKKGKRVTSVISGTAHVNDALQTWVAKAIVQKWSDMAVKGKVFSAKRLADLGLDDAMFKRIQGEFTKAGNFDFARGPLSGKKVVRAHFDKWDPEVREAFRRAAYRSANQIIQKNDIGNLSMWMSGPGGKMFMQFRTFMAAAYEKQTLRMLHLRDTPAVTAALMSMTFGGAIYAVQEKLRSIGRSDHDEYLEKRLSWDNLGKAAFARAGFSSILPMMYDTTLARAIQGEPAFDFRSSGQPSDLFGNPTFGYLDVANAVTAAVARPAIKGRAPSQDEMRAAERILPFGNFLPVTMLYNSLISGLPEHTPRNLK